MLASCTDEELQDIYFHIDVLQYPERYHAILDELNRRGLQPVSGVEPPVTVTDIPERVFAVSCLRARPLMAAVVASTLLAAYTASITFLFCLPIYLLAVPFKVLNQVSAFFYLLCFPFAPIAAAGFGRRAGGKGWYNVAVALGVALGIMMFAGTGALHTVVEALFRSYRSGGLSLPVGY
ncbi:MAG: hypothetical protein K6U75_06735 [Firmicutes bacterium]|nr:hypothetical protein [Bacillota bacterium]